MNEKESLLFLLEICCSYLFCLRLNCDGHFSFLGFNIYNHIFLQLNKHVFLSLTLISKVVPNTIRLRLNAHFTSKRTDF